MRTILPGITLTPPQAGSILAPRLSIESRLPPSLDGLMKVARTLVPFLLLAVLVAGCGDDDPSAPETGLTLGDLVGSWIATSDTHTNNANAAESFDMIAAGGEVRVTVLASGGARTWVEFGTFSDEWDAAITLSGNTLTSDPVEVGRPTVTWTVTLVNDVLTLTRTDAEWDFTLTGAQPVSTTEVIAFVPN
jgi:hypothetical protein